MTPHSTDAEKGFLSSLLQNPSVLDQAADTLKPNLFHVPTHRAVFDAVVSLWREGSAIDLITVGEKATGVDPSSLAEIYSFVPTSRNWQEYLSTLKKKRTARVSIAEANKIIESASNPETEDTLSDTVQKALVAVAAEAESGSNIESIEEAVDKRIDEYENIIKNKGKLMGLTYGLPPLDKHTGGMRQGQLIVLGGQTKSGKTALALNVAYMTANAGNKVGFISLEMPSGELIDRLVASSSGVDISMLSKGINESDFKKMEFSLNQIKKLPIWIRDESQINPMQMMAAARRMVAAHGIQILFVDYLQLISASNTKESRERQVAECSRCLKLIAKELKITVFALTQLNSENNARESRAIEMDADLFLVISHGEKGGVSLDIRLGRACSRASFPMEFRSNYLRFDPKD